MIRPLRPDHSKTQSTKGSRFAPVHEPLFVQERVKPQEERNQADHDKVEELRGSPLAVGTLEEIIDENHAIVSTSVGPEYYVAILQLVDRTQLEPGCTVLLHNKAMAVVGILSNEADPMVSVMKVDQAPTESYADVGGLESQIQVCACLYANLTSLLSGVCLRWMPAASMPFPASITTRYWAPTCRTCKVGDMAFL
jgi:ATP-dependent 26S proteasome regulatory subunit